MKLQESAIQAVERHLGTRVPGDLLIQEALSAWLFENRIQKLIAHTKEIDSSHDSAAEHRTPKAIIHHLAQRFDPTEGKVHTEHLLKWYQGGHFRQEDHQDIRGTLKRYEKNKGNLPFKPQDFGHPADLSDAMDKHLGVTHASDFAKSMSPQDRDAVERGSELVHNDENFEIRKLRSKAHHLIPEEAAKADPHSRRAMQILGDKTSWCTTPKDSHMFEFYSKNGPLYWIYDKKNGRRDVFLEGHKQFVDEKNRNNYIQLDQMRKVESRFKPIEHLLHKFNYTEEKDLIASGKSTLEQQEKFLNHQSPRLSISMSQRKDLHPTLQRKYLIDQPHPNEEVRRQIAQNSNLSSEDIHHLLVTKPDKSVQIRSALIDPNNPNQDIRPDTIHHVLHSKYDYDKLQEHNLRLKIIRNNNISSDTIHSYLKRKDLDPHIAKELFLHPKLSSSAIHDLLSRPEPFDFYSDMHEKLARHQNITSDTVHHYLVDSPHKEISVRGVLASNKKIKPETIHSALLTKPDSSDYVRQTLGENKNISSDTIHEILTNKPDSEMSVNCALASNKNIRPDTIHQNLLVNPLKVKNAHFLWSSLAGNNNIHPDTLHKLLLGIRDRYTYTPKPDSEHNQYTHPHVLHAALSNPQIHPDTIHELVTSGGFPDVGGLISNWRKLKPETIKHISNPSFDSGLIERALLTSTSGIPKEIAHRVLRSRKNENSSTWEEHNDSFEFKPTFREKVAEGLSDPELQYHVLSKDENGKPNEPDTSVRFEALKSIGDNSHLLKKIIMNNYPTEDVLKKRSFNPHWYYKNKYSPEHEMSQDNIRLEHMLDKMVHVDKELHDHLINHPNIINSTKRYISHTFGDGSYDSEDDDF